MLGEITRGILPGSLSDHCNYPEAIHEHGGIDAVANYLVQLINPQLHSLQGKEVSKNTLATINAVQIHEKELWNVPLGYAAILTDDRQSLWWRLLGYGLNVMSPLVQGNVAFTTELRVRANVGPAKSPDRQIQHWAAFNRKQKADTKSQRSANSSNERPVFERDFDNALRLALDGNELVFQTLKTFLQQPQELRTQESPTTPQLAHIPFCGSLSAEVAAILDYAAVSAAECTPMKRSNDDLAPSSVPWSLEGCGFTEANILIWTCRFKGFTELDIDHLDHSILSQPGVKEWHQTLLRESQAKIILLCGPQAERTIKAVLAPKNLCRYTLSLRGFSYPLYHDTVRNRLFVRCPALPAEIWSISAYNSVRISEVIRFVIHFTPSLKKQIRPYFCENSGVLGFIFRQARKEKLGAEPMTAADIDDGVQLWLRRRNLGSVEAIKRIEEIGGSLTRGLLMLLQFLPRRPKGKTGTQQSSSGKRVRSSEKFDKENFSEMKELVTKAIDERDAKYESTRSHITSEPQTGSALVEHTTEHQKATLESVAALESFASQEQELCGPEGVHDFLSQRRPAASGLESEAEAEAEDEAEADILQTLAAKAIDDGFLDLDLTEAASAEASQIVKRERQWKDKSTSLNAQELSTQASLLSGRTYQGALDEGGGTKILVHSYIRLRLPHIRKESIDNFKVFAEINTEEQGRNPNVWAINAKDGDPGCRLAFRVVAKDTSGSEQAYYPASTNVFNVWKANSFVDWMEGESIHQISTKPRRYIYLPRHTINVPSGLKRYKGGAYNDDDMNVVTFRARNKRFGAKDQGSDVRNSSESERCTGEVVSTGNGDEGNDSEVVSVGDEDEGSDGEVFSD
ncbi:hypothetical protein BO96DRAFT_428126 [Aspergillus terreus]|uniref:Uncharacterized protein n=1 Tax=Aspergillus terreus TaxID=33178 RepID=A0A5M3Z283_ASPTE|nr:hypothetical protein ATETN484_0007035000 [Aspergillus terreus]GFF16155.1 hypothetical protein BO96DRAFT_428126 [Aspergillus terreus]